MCPRVRGHQPAVEIILGYRTEPDEDSIQKRVVLNSEKQRRTHFETLQFLAITQIVGHPHFELFDFPRRFKLCVTPVSLTPRHSSISWTDCDGLASTKAFNSLSWIAVALQLRLHFKVETSRTKFLELPLHILSPTLFGLHTWLICRTISTKDWPSLKLK